MVLNECYSVFIRWAAAICRLCRVLLSAPGSIPPPQQMEADQPLAEDDKHEKETTSASPSNAYTKSEKVSRSKRLRMTWSLLSRLRSSFKGFFQLFLLVNSNAPIFYDCFSYKCIIVLLFYNGLEVKFVRARL